MGALVAGVLVGGASCGSSNPTTPPPAEAGPEAAGDGAVEASTPEAGDASIPSCADYCAKVLQACTGAAAQYLDNASCMAICALFAPGTAGDTSGDSLACRASYATQAAGAGSCAAAGPLGGGVCGIDSCAAFCELDLALCTGALAAYASAGACASACAAFPGQGDAGVGTTSGNTLGCRLYYLELSSTGPVAATNYCHDTAVVSSLCSPDGG